MRRAVAVVIAVATALSGFGSARFGPVAVLAADAIPVVTVKAEGADLVVSWPAVPGANRYQGRHRPTESTQWTWNTASAARSWTIPGANTGTPRVIEVRALVQNVWRDWATVEWPHDDVRLEFDDYVDDVGLGIDSVDGFGHTFGKPCVVDINADELLDVIWSNHYDAPWDVFLGTTDGGYAEDLRTDWSEGLGDLIKDNHSCAAADFDGDGLVDLYESVGACEGTCAKANPLWMQNPDGSFTNRALELVSPAITYDRSRAPVALDGDGDGDLDLFVAAEGGGTVYPSDNRYLRNDGGTFVTATAGVEENGHRVHCAVTADLDADGDQDLIVCRENDFDVYANDGSGQFTRNSFGMSPPPLARAVEFVDIDRDGAGDLVLITATRVQVRLGRSGDYSSIDFSYSVQDGRDVVTPDVDGDGWLDLYLVLDASNADPAGMRADIVLRHRGTSSPAFERLEVPQSVRGRGDSATVLPDFWGSGFDAVLVSNGWYNHRGDRQVIAVAGLERPEAPAEPAMLIVSTDPPKGSIELDGVVVDSGTSVASSVGSSHTLRAPATMAIGPFVWHFERWNDGGSAGHSITAGRGSYRLTAKYRCPFEPGHVWCIEAYTDNFSPSIAVLEDRDDLEGVVVDITLDATDPDGDVLSFAAQNLPPGIEIDPDTGRITGTIGSSAASESPYSVTITAADGNGGATTASFTWLVEDPGGNHHPFLEQIDDRLDIEGAAVEIATDAMDPDGDELTFAGDGLPAGIEIDPMSGQITGTIAGGASAGSPYHVTVTVTDGNGGLATASFTWVVEARVNHEPSIAAIPDRDDVEGADIDLALDAVDPDGDTLSFAAAGLPAGIEIDPVSGEITGIIDDGASAASPHTVTITVADGEGGVASTTFTWVVHAPRVLYIAASPDPPPDRPLINHLRSRGFEVTVIDDDELASPAEAEAYELVWISSTVVPGKIGSTYARIATPLGTHEAFLYDDLAMATKFGQQSGQTSIVDVASHQQIVVTSAPELLSWGVPATSASVIATLRNQVTRATVFFYPSGARLTNGTTAASCRGAFFPTHKTPMRFTPAAYTAFDDMTDTLLDC